MKAFACMACIVVLLPAVAHAQKTAYVVYDGALMYDDADYLADVVDTLSLGDSVRVLDRDRRFAHVACRDRTGWVLLANISERAPRSKNSRSATGAPGDSVATSMKARSSRSREFSDESGSTTNIDSATSGTSLRKSNPAKTKRTTRADSDSTAQCSGTTKSGKQCSRKTTSESSYCWQHAKR